MSDIANKRRLMESVHALVKTRQIDAGQIAAVMTSFEAVINDVSDEPMALALDTLAAKDDPLMPVIGSYEKPLVRQADAMAALAEKTARIEVLEAELALLTRGVKIRIPTDAIEQEFQRYYLRGVAFNDAEIVRLRARLDTADAAITRESLRIESVQGDMLKARSILLRWCNDGMNDTQTKRLRQKTLEFCAVKS